MTEVLYNPKIKPEHLARKAIVYLRQSSDRQVRQNKESQLLQYAVAERVRALGWHEGSSVRPGSKNGAKARDGSPGNLGDPAHVHVRANRQIGSPVEQ